MLYFRRAVPIALRLRVGTVLGRPGKAVGELKWTLGTHDLREAKALMPTSMAKSDAIFAAAAHGASPLTSREAHALAGKWYQRRLGEWEADPTTVHNWDHWGEGMPTDIFVEGTENEEAPAISKQGAREWRVFLASLRPEVEELLSDAGVVTDDASKERLAELIVERLPQALAQHQRRQRGDFSPDKLVATFPAWERSEDPATPPLAPTPEAVVSFLGLFKAWSPVAVVKPRTLAETDYAVRKLASFVGHDDAARITRDDLMRWRDTMKTDGRVNSTWNNRLSMVGQVLQHGVTEGLLKTNPASGLRLRKSRAISPLPYDDTDAARILLAARLETRPSLRWAHWVMAFTGMRAGEVLQLLGNEVRQEDGVWFIDVNERTEGASVKTGTTRHVPVHPALIAEGFIAYTQTIAATAPVFPDKRPDKFGNRGGRAWNVTGIWARKTAGITDPAKAPDHSWRHRVEDELRAAEVPEDVRDAITGHARKTTGRQYGVRGEALKRLHRYLSRLPVPAGVMPGQNSRCADMTQEPNS